MTLSAFARSFLFDANKPRFRDYPTLLDDGENLPALETSLEQIGEYQRRLWANRARALLLVAHGPDTSGKDSLIRTLATYADPAGFHAWSFSRPQGAETRHDFLWRVMPFLPGFGEMVAFNRSHHEAVIAERVWPVHEPESYNWQNRYHSIRNFEGHLVEEGTTLIKIWLNLSEDEHRQRLLKRLDKPRKRWKFDKSDIDGWEKRGQYEAFAEEAMAATHTGKAPWFIVPGDRKPQARAVVAAVLAEQLQRLAPEYPKEDEGVLDEYRRLLAKNGVK
ncbi:MULTISPECIES: polyphosphate kinase 2 family protein [Marinobacter]|uniref:Polyphosphate kinase n=1 Tax=Marinobacter metalliresistant TaxID=2961995 RepID=A0ABZ2VX33_9GAMM|nr:polyphosphate kinase [Marinobacter sp. Arc7-DN-1]AXS83544.1 polyphosphate kinase [Marinobacter sp. Arc7-DN-1]